MYDCSYFLAKSERFRVKGSKSRVRGVLFGLRRRYIGALIDRIRFGGILYYQHNKEPQDSVGIEASILIVILLLSGGWDVRCSETSASGWSRPSPSKRYSLYLTRSKTRIQFTANLHMV